MRARDGHDPLVALNLPAAIRAQAAKLLQAIKGSRSTVEVMRAADRAEGFALGIETVRALNAIDVENLYVVFDAAAQARHAELGK